MSEEDDEKKAILCKVILMGESGVGKTNIISKYMTKIFNPSIVSTPRANFTTKTVLMEETLLNPNLWFY